MSKSCPTSVALQVAEAAPQPAQAAASGPSVGSPAALLGLAAVVVGAVLFAKRTQPETDSKSSSGGGQSSGKAASASSGGQAPQSAGACVHPLCETIVA